MIDEDASELSRHLWEEHAQWWQDEFTDGVDPEYTEQILPLTCELLARGGVDPGSGPLVDIGTGEGQVARYLSGQGYDVIGVDPVKAQIDEARRRGGPPRYVRAGADRLPLADNSCAGRCGLSRLRTH